MRKGQKSIAEYEGLLLIFIPKQCIIHTITPRIFVVHSISLWQSVLIYKMKILLAPHYIWQFYYLQYQRSYKYWVEYLLI